MNPRMNSASGAVKVLSFFLFDLRGRKTTLFGANLLQPLSFFFNPVAGRPTDIHRPLSAIL
jgi:hypothetical protein